jgi:hypothetical protein
MILIVPNLALAAISLGMGRLSFDSDGRAVLLALLTPAVFSAVLFQRARHLPEPINRGMVWWAACMSTAWYVVLAVIFGAGPV